MSRIGLSPVTVPDGVELKLDGQTVSAKGKLGELSVRVSDDVEIVQDGNVLNFKPKNMKKETRQKWGLYRSLVSNIVTGVSEGFTRSLDITGVGYRASVQGKKLRLQLGFSHDVEYEIPEGITIECPEPTQIRISGADNQRVGQVAAELRGYRPPEPYKGKGVRYSDEQILRKEGKKK
jgi:large subunit ribosomal protein L6